MVTTRVGDLAERISEGVKTGASVVKCGVEETEQEDVREGSGLGCRVPCKATGLCIGLGQ